MYTISVHLQKWLTGWLGILFVSLSFKDSCVYTYEYQFDFPAFIDGKGCPTPNVGPFSPIVAEYYKKLDPLKCNNEKRLPLVNADSTDVYINSRAVSLYYKEPKDLDCCWRAIYRMEGNDDEVEYDTVCHHFEKSATVNHTEIVKVECRLNQTLIYKDVFAFLPPSPTMEQKHKKLRESDLKDSVNVLILTLSSVSRNNFYRMMPKTVRLLKALEAAEMLGFVKVEENSFPNTVPAMTGLTVPELQKVCWPSKMDTLDNCPFIWKNFSAAGYQTIYAADGCWVAPFHYVLRGFREPPTDYYYRPFCLTSEREIGHSRATNVIQCLGTRTSLNHLLSYAKKAATQFADDQYFAMIGENTITHDAWEYAQWADDEYYELIHDLYTESLLQNTILIVMSDHGSRWGAFWHTYQGKMEDSRPGMFVVAPYWWRSKYRTAWMNIQNNAARLTTAFDLYETLKDLLNNERLEEQQLKTRTVMMMTSEDLPRGISLFLPIPDYRTCALADIPERWCICHESKKLPLDDGSVVDKAVMFVSKLNEMLKDYPECARLQLKAIHGAVALRNRYNDKTVHTLTIQTTPGNGIFEATIDFERNTTHGEFVGTVRRLNSYGRQSICIKNQMLKRFCYCS